MTRLLEKLTTCKRALAREFSRRPFAVTGILVAALFWTAGSTFGVLGAQQNRDDIREIRQRFCVASQPRVERCERLIDALLKSPTPAQVERLRDIIGVSP